MTDVEVRAPLTLGAFLKVSGAAASGGRAKVMVREGRVRVNGAVETRRGRKVVPGDVVEVGGEEYRACSSLD